MPDAKSDPTLEEQVSDLREGFATLRDGKWDRNDARAIGVILGALAGIVALGMAALDRFDPPAPPEPAPIEAPADTDTDGGDTDGGTDSTGD